MLFIVVVKRNVEENARKSKNTHASDGSRRVAPVTAPRRPSSRLLGSPPSLLVLPHSITVEPLKRLSRGDCDSQQRLLSRPSNFTRPHHSKGPNSSRGAGAPVACLLATTTHATPVQIDRTIKTVDVHSPLESCLDC